MKLSINIKRIFAYILDIIIVTFVASLIGKTPLNPLNDDYEKVSSKYQDEYTEYSNLIVELSDLYKTDSFTNEKVNEVFEKYKVDIKEVITKEEIVREDYNSVSESVSSIYLNRLNNYAYEMDKTSIYFNIINVGIILLYFVLMEYFMKGQTLGKRICKIQVVSVCENKKPSVIQFLVRNIILYNILASIISLILLFTLNKNSYIEVNSIIRLIFSVVELINYGFIIFSKDKRGIHDYASQTRVVEYIKEVQND